MKCASWAIILAQEVNLTKTNRSKRPILFIKHLFRYVGFISKYTVINASTNLDSINDKNNKKQQKQKISCTWQQPTIYYLPTFRSKCKFTFAKSLFSC